MPKPPSKQQLREQLQRQMQRYLQQGGEVHSFERGASGLQDGRYSERSLGFEKPAAERTPVDDVVRTIDQRRRQRKHGNKNHTRRSPQPKRRVIYDDFGEPLRVVWDDD